ncbi:MAG: MAPEG family protein [Beijerinckiaceae bacterium]
MSGHVLLYPILVQIALTFFIGIQLARARFKAGNAGQVKLRDVALSNDSWPDNVKAISNNYSNQFETPVLFYVLVAMAIYVGSTGWLMQALAWFFVGTRIVHSLIHTGGNNVIRRFQTFLLGVLSLVAMFVIICVTVL